MSSGPGSSPGAAERAGGPRPPSSPERGSRGRLPSGDVARSGAAPIEDQEGQGGAVGKPRNGPLSWLGSDESPEVTFADFLQNKGIAVIRPPPGPFPRSLQGVLRCHGHQASRPGSGAPSARPVASPFGSERPRPPGPSCWRLGPCASGALAASPGSVCPRYRFWCRGSTRFATWR